MAFGFLSRSGSGHQASPKLRPRRSRFVAEVSALEEKKLMSFVVRATAVPNIIYPATGKYIPVVVSGEAIEYHVTTPTVDGVTKVDVTYETLPGPKIARYRVVDEYREDEPQGNITLTPVGGGVFNFSFTVYLQASRSSEAIAGRRYYVDITANDIDKSFGGEYVPVQVPHSLTDRGPGPKLPPTKTTTTTVSAATTTKKAAATHPATATNTVTTKTTTKTSSSIGSFFSSLI